MSQISIKKPIMKVLGIEELINQYEQHCTKMSSQKPGAVQQKNCNRYASLLQMKGQNSTNLKNSSQNEKQMLQLNKIYMNKSFQFNHSSQHHSTLNTQIRKYKHLKQSAQKNPSSKPNKNTFSSINFTKKSTIQQHESHRKTSIKNHKNFLSSQPSLINSQTLIKVPVKSYGAIKNDKRSINNSSYLSFKDKNQNKSKTLKQQKVEIVLNNPTLTGINKKIKQFQKRVLKKQHPTQFRKSVKPQNEQNDFHQEKRVKTVRISQTIHDEKQKSQQKEKEFVSIDTNYYGFSFKNKISVVKNGMNKQQPKQQNSTIDKSGNDQQILKPAEVDSKNNSSSTSKMQSTKKSYATLNSDKKSRYQSTLLLKNKKPNSSLLLKPKLLLKDRYQLIKVIGRGMSGEVYQAKDILSNRFVVIKEIDVNSIEYEFFRQISHQNIIKYYNNFVENGKRYLVLEYFPLTLKDLLKDSKKSINLTDDDVKHIFRSVLTGLAYLHSLSIAHRDIKLDNIVISEDLKEIKFIDFGLCLDLSKIQHELSKQFCGTLSYLPPQIIQGKPHEPRKADIWSLGIVLYAISLGRLPFKGKNESDILNKICKGKLIYPQSFDQELKQLIDWMLEKNPSKRCTVSQIMSHMWLH